MIGKVERRPKKEELMNPRERKVYEAFKNAGWEVVYEPEKLRVDERHIYIPDFALYYENELYGYVEAISSIVLSPVHMMKKITLIKGLIKKYKPFIFIITEGDTLYIYKGDKTETVHFFISPLSLVLEYKKEKGGKE